MIIRDVVVQYNELANESEMKTGKPPKFVTRWGYVTREVLVQYNEWRSKQITDKDAEERRFMVFLPNGTLANVALAHMTLVEPFACTVVPTQEAFTSPSSAMSVPQGMMPRPQLKLVEDETDGCNLMVKKEKDVEQCDEGILKDE